MASSSYPGVDIIAQPPSVGAKVIRNGTHSIPNNTDSKVQWTGALWDTDSMWDIANPYRITAKTPGKYLIVSKLRWSASQAGTRQMSIVINNLAKVPGSVNDSATGNTVGQDQMAFAVVDLAVGDYIEVWVWQNSGGGVDLENASSTDRGPSLSAMLLSGNANGLPSAARAVAALQSIAHNTDTDLTFSSVELDTDTMWSSATPTRVYARKAGVYMVSGTAIFDGAGSSGHVRGVEIHKNGVAQSYQRTPPLQAGYSTVVSTATVVKVDVGDYLTLRVIHNQGTSLNVSGHLEMVSVSGTTVSTRKPPYAYLARLADTAVSAGAEPTIVFDHAYADTDGVLRLSDGKAVIKIPGLYDIKTGFEFFGSAATGKRQAGIYVNGVLKSVISGPASSDAYVHFGPSITLDLKAGDVVDARTYSSHAVTVIGSLNASYRCWMTLELVQPISQAALMAPEAWHEVGTTGEPGFQNSWTNYGSGYSTVAFYKDPLGVVRLKGLTKFGSSNLIFTLPSGYRPSGHSIYPTSSNALFSNVYVNSTGDVRVEPPYSNSWVGLDTISFRAA